MPFATAAKARPSGTGRGCRAVVAAGLLAPGSEWTVLRALQIANFTGSVYLDDGESIREALRAVSNTDADRIAAMLDDDEVVVEYERQLAEARSAAGTPAHAQEKTVSADGQVRFTAPSVVFRRGEQSAFAGGWQPLLSYDTVLANFAPELERVPPPDSPETLLEFFPERTHDGRGCPAPRGRPRSSPRSGCRGDVVVRPRRRRKGCESGAGQRRHLDSCLTAAVGGLEELAAPDPRAVQRRGAGYDHVVSVTPDETTVGEVMVRKPKTLPADVTVADARKVFEHASVKMLLLVEGDRFRGAVTAIPADAEPEDLALRFVDRSPVTVTADMPASEALGAWTTSRTGE